VLDAYSPYGGRATSRRLALASRGACARSHVQAGAPSIARPAPFRGPRHAAIKWSLTPHGAPSSSIKQPATSIAPLPQSAFRIQLIRAYIRAYIRVYPGISGHRSNFEPQPPNQPATRSCRAGLPRSRGGDGSSPLACTSHRAPAHPVETSSLRINTDIYGFLRIILGR
jgi:hypothetical protein